MSATTTNMRKKSSIDINKHDALNFLNNCEFRVIDGDERNFYRPQVLYEGEWKDLCRTDLRDDVRTIIVEKHFLEDPISYFKKRCHFGARIYPGGFAVIDSLSDG